MEQKNLVEEAMKKVAGNDAKKDDSNPKVRTKPIVQQIPPIQKAPQQVPTLPSTVTNVVNKPIRPTVTIKYRGLETVVDRKMFINVQEAPDGLVFNFANGMHLVYTNQHMPSSSKIRVTAAANTFLAAPNKGSITINLDNQAAPVSIKL